MKFLVAEYFSILHKKVFSLFIKLVWSLRYRAFLIVTPQEAGPPDFLNSAVWSARRMADLADSKRW